MTPYPVEGYTGGRNLGDERLPKNTKEEV
jgi:hypothetical protein